MPLYGGARIIGNSHGVVTQGTAAIAWQHTDGNRYMLTSGRAVGPASSPVHVLINPHGGTAQNNLEYVGGVRVNLYRSNDPGHRYDAALVSANDIQIAPLTLQWPVPGGVQTQAMASATQNNGAQPGADLSAVGGRSGLLAGQLIEWSVTGHALGQGDVVRFDQMNLLNGRHLDPADSGGPVFAGNQFLGILSGELQQTGRCGFTPLRDVVGLLGL